MRVLSPIDVESYSKKFEALLSEIERASNLLLPDVYFQDQETLLQVRDKLSKDSSLFDQVLNMCSEGVLISEAFNVNATVEANVKQSVISVLWKCQDYIADILLLSADLDDFLVNLTVADPLVWKLDYLCDAQKKFNRVVMDLEDAATTISYVIGHLDD